MIILDFFKFRRPLDNLVSKLVFQVVFELCSNALILYVVNRKIPERYDEPIHGGTEQYDDRASLIIKV
jgi:hypothetical protein